MIRHPVAGNIMAFMSYLLGLQRLGHQVTYVEESGWAGSCYDPRTLTIGDDPAAGLEITRGLAKLFGLEVPMFYVNRDSGVVSGGKWHDAKDALANADALINLGGVCWLAEFKLARTLVFVDMDPMFTQVGRFGLGAVEEHHVHFSYGVNIGRPGCTIPTRGIDWLPTVPPVVTDIWPVRDPIPGAHFTTIANWSAYAGVEFEGEHYGQKDEEFLRFVELPHHTSEVLEVAAAGITAKDATTLREHGWLISSAAEASHGFDRYREYIGMSAGELTMAKNAYVKSRSGWFSDRSVCYLASGRPVIMQDTALSEWLDVGTGLLTFSSLDEAAVCLESAVSAYSRHRLAARALAEKVFEATSVVASLMDRASRSFAVATGSGG